MTYHKSIDTLRIYHYNIIVERKDLKHLVIDKDAKVDDNTLAVAWSDIISEYIAATAHRQNNSDVYDLQKHIFDLTIEYNEVNVICFCLSHCWCDDYLIELANCGYSISDPSEIIGVMNQNKLLLTERRELEFELSNRLKKTDKNISFDVIIDRISDHKKYRLNPREITVREWIAIEDNYLNDIKQHQHASR